MMNKALRGQTLFPITLEMRLWIIKDTCVAAVVSDTITLVSNIDTLEYKEMSLYSL